VVRGKRESTAVVKNWRMAKLKFRIENLRIDLNESVKKYGISSPIVLKKSVELDRVLNRYDSYVAEYWKDTGKIRAER
ncbi:aspartyl-phosphate phosphatase Spo0E family protein, partial [Klebsiella pneumoniae]